MIYTVESGSYCKYTNAKLHLNLSNLAKGHTYVSILCLNNGYTNNQQKVIAALLDECKDINILYKSPLAVNKNPQHGTFPRNCVYVFHYPLTCEQSPVGAPDVKKEDKTLEATTY